MSSFLSIWENMQKSRRDKKDVKSIIHIGYNIAETFWDNFIQILQHSEPISKLLDVPEHKVATWKEKIESAIEHEKSHDSLVTQNHKIVKEEHELSLVRDKIQKIMDIPNKNRGLTMFFEDKLNHIVQENIHKLGTQDLKKVSSIRDISEEQRNVILQSIIQASMNIFFSNIEDPDVNLNKSNLKDITTSTIHPKDIF